MAGDLICGSRVEGILPLDHSGPSGFRCQSRPHTGIVRTASPSKPQRDVILSLLPKPLSPASHQWTNGRLCRDTAVLPSHLQLGHTQGRAPLGRAETVTLPQITPLLCFFLLSIMYTSAPPPPPTPTHMPSTPSLVCPGKSKSLSQTLLQEK